MAKNDGSKLLWAPRFLAVAFIVLLVYLSLDTLKGNGVFSEKLTALLPALVTFIVIAVTWKKATLTGLYFLLFAASFSVYLVTSGTGDADAYLIMGLIPGIIGFLYVLFGKKAPVKAAPASKIAPQPVEVPAAPAEVPAEEPKA